MKESVVLAEDLAAVRFCPADRDEPTGAITVIPATAVIRMDGARPALRRMRKVIWNGETYGVFTEDLIERLDRPNAHRVDNPNAHRVDNPGIVRIEPAKN